MNKKSKSPVFQRISDLMEINKISYRTLSERTGLSNMGLYKMINNESLTVHNLMKVCDALGVKPCDVLEDPRLKMPVNNSVQLLKMQDNARDIQRIAAQLERDLSKLK